MLYILKIIQALAVRFLFARYLFGTVGALLVALPVAAILKAIGLPLLIILGIIAGPVLVILLIVGLPVLGVLFCAALLVGLIALVMALGLVALKFALFVVLPIAMLVWIVRRVRSSGGARQAHAA